MDDGKLAQERGLLRTENPHPLNSMLSDCWMEGYDEGGLKEEHDLRQIEE